MSANTPVSKIDFKRQLQRLRQGFEQQSMLGNVVIPFHSLIMLFQQKRQRFINILQI